MDEYPSLEELLPHRGAMLLLERVLAFTAEEARCACTVRGDAWYAQGGRIPAWIGLELMAQTCGVHAGLNALRQGSPPRKGALLGSRAYRAGVAYFGDGERLTVAARNVYWDASGLGAYDCAIFRRDQELAAARLTVYEPEDFGRFILNGPRE